MRLVVCNDFQILNFNTGKKIKSKTTDNRISHIFIMLAILLWKFRFSSINYYYLHNISLVSATYIFSIQVPTFIST